MKSIMSAPYHRNLVDDYELEFTYEFDENRRIFHAFGQAFAVKVGVFGRDRLERYSEKRVECLATGIDSRYAGRSEHYVWFVGMACDVAQKRRFACACPCRSEILIGWYIATIPKLSETRDCQVNHLLRVVVTRRR